MLGLKDGEDRMEGGFVRTKRSTSEQQLNCVGISTSIAVRCQKRSLKYWHTSRYFALYRTAAATPWRGWVNSWVPRMHLPLLNRNKATWSFLQPWPRTQFPCRVKAIIIHIFYFRSELVFQEILQLSKDWEMEKKRRERFQLALIPNILNLFAVLAWKGQPNATQEHPSPHQHKALDVVIKIEWGFNDLKVEN